MAKLKEKTRALGGSELRVSLPRQGTATYSLIVPAARPSGYEIRTALAAWGVAWKIQNRAQTPECPA